MEVRNEDLAQLAPLGYELIRLIGSYDFTFPKRCNRGNFRPFRHPGQDD